LKEADCLLGGCGGIPHSMVCGGMRCDGEASLMDCMPFIQRHLSCVVCDVQVRRETVCM